jgi:hypothetical protein
VASEGFQSGLREFHCAAAALGLGRGKDRAALHGGKGAPHLQSPSLKVNIIPFEPQQLSLPETGGDGQDIEGSEAVTLRGLEQCLHLVRTQRSYLFAPYLRRLDDLSGVARDEAVGDGLLERLVKSDMDVLDGARRESIIKLLAVESAHVGRGEVLELQLTQHRAYVKADHLLITLKARGSYGVTHAISKPPPQILVQLQIIGLEDKAFVPASRAPR